MFREPHRTTIAKYLKQNNITKTKGQTLTEAKRKACQDPRMSYSWYLCCEAFSSNLPGEKKWNADGTTFEIIDRGYGGMYLTVLCEKNECKRVQVSNLENSLPVYIKYMAMCNACGNSSSLVLIVAIGELPEDSFHIFDIA